MIRELSTEEVCAELTHLDSSNGWGITEYRDGVLISRKKLISAIASLIELHGSYPIGKGQNSDFTFLITKDSDGLYIFGYTMEVSMLNYKKFFDQPAPLTNCVERLASQWFQDHLNKIKIIN